MRPALQKDKIDYLRRLFFGLRILEGGLDRLIEADAAGAPQPLLLHARLFHGAVKFGVNPFQSFKRIHLSSFTPPGAESFPFPPGRFEALAHFRRGIEL